jgi:hypothetical protein
MSVHDPDSPCVGMEGGAASWLKHDRSCGSALRPLRVEVVLHRMTMYCVGGVSEDGGGM